MTEGTVPGGHVFFQADHRLEGMLEWPDEDAPPGASPSSPAPCATGGVVVAHPHSLYGGTMAHPVVYRTAQACREMGFATLRFNFRGVGESLGSFSGTQEDRDVEAAAAFLAGRLREWEGGVALHRDQREAGPAVALAGYSFGSIMSARAAAGPVPVHALALIGFVVSWEALPADTLKRLSAFQGPVLAICAENDDLGFPEDVDRVLAGLGVDYRLEVIRNAGHFLEGRQREVGDLVAAFVASVMPPGSHGARE